MSILPGALKKHYVAWLKRRNPVATEVELNQKRIFIFPTYVGMLYGVLLILIFVNAINYKNNLLFALCFLLASIFVTAILHTFNNFSGLIVKAGHSLPAFVGDTVLLPITLNGGSSDRHSLTLRFSGEAPTHIAWLKQEALRAQISFTPNKRGWIETPRLKLRSVYPLGLIRSWSWLYLDFRGVIYPKPVSQPFKYYVEEGGHEQGDLSQIQEVEKTGIDDFRGFKTYSPGDPLKHIAWKQYAKGGELLTKEFEETHVSAHWLDWRALSGVEVETRLQILCGWVLRSHEENFEYGLKLPGQTIRLGRGDHHRDECLKALALFRRPAAEKSSGVKND